MSPQIPSSFIKFGTSACRTSTRYCQPIPDVRTNESPLYSFRFTALQICFQGHPSLQSQHCLFSVHQLAFERRSAQSTEAAFLTLCYRLLGLPSGLSKAGCIKRPTMYKIIKYSFGGIVGMFNLIKNTLVKMS